MSNYFNITGLKAVYAIILITATYYAYYFPAFSTKTSIWFRKKYGGNRSIIYLFMFQKLLGFILLGPVAALLFFPFFTLNPRNFNLFPFIDISPWSIMAVLIPLIVVLIYFSARNSEIYLRIPHMRLNEWKSSHVLTSITGWGLYLLGYEFIFRELLLVSWAEEYGVIPAIVVNVSLYSAFHLPNGRKETIGSIFFGLLLCIVSLQSGSFALAFLLHFTLSVSTEMFSIYHNPEMQFNLKRVAK